MREFFDGFGEWVKRPYSPDMTVLDWLLFVGLLVTAIFVWTQLIRKVVD